MNAHIEESAALYALGALDAAQAAAIEAHVRECASCAREVGDAEAAVALLVSAEARHTPPRELGSRIERSLYGSRPGLPAFAAIAAALVIGLLPSAWFWSENRAMHEAMATQSAAMDRLANAPHLSAAFTPMPGAAATVAYARSGSWYVILVKGSPRPLSVAWMHDGQRTMLGRAVPHGGMAMLYLPKSHRMNQLALMDGEQIVAEASLTYE
jgi:anti-sigma-K factor RskA